MTEQTPKEQCEYLMREVLPLAKRMLSECAEFFPYGGVINTDGSLTHVGAKEEGTDRPGSKILIEILTQNFQESALCGRIRASAIICDVLIQPPGASKKVDAVQANLDHLDGYSVRVFFPYTIINGTLLFEKPFAQEGDHLIFKR
ncbi:MAG: hypothetical protein V4599_13100 [Verrucomicrobiota bacterium]